MAMALRAGRAGATAVIVTAALLWLSCGDGASRNTEPLAPGVEASLLRLREAALARAKVWRPPAGPIAKADLLTDGPGPVKPPDRIECRYQLKLTSGITPKFHCVLADGRVIKVKYGRLNAEPRTERAATRLLSALGFGADRMYVVERVRCNGCPTYPHPRWGLLNPLFARRHVDFEEVAVEDPMPGRSIEAGETEGWAFYELDRIDPARGGASRAEVDALRLMAVFLANWDNKASNQRLVCLPGGDLPGGGCDTPFAYFQDVGSTFGPKGLNLEAWRATPVWADPKACLVSMKSLPFQGATFRDTVISEGGRRLLADELTQLLPQQVRDLFTGAGFTEYARSSEAGRDAANWAAAFEDKVKQIADRPPCPEP
jgi:hypothetical protein